MTFRDPAAAATVTELPDAACAALHNTQQLVFNGAEHGRARCLVATAHTWREYYRQQLPPLDAPWWAYRQTGPAAFSGVLWVDPALPCFAGHFPGNPILPGLVQIDWAVTEAAAAFSGAAEDKFRGMSNIKFKAPVAPATWLQLELHRLDNGCVDFAFHGGGRLRTRGRLQYGPPAAAADRG